MMSKVDVETVVRLHTDGVVLEVGTDPTTGSLVEIRTPDARSIEWYGEVRLGLQPETAVALAHALLKVAETLRYGHG